MAGLGEACSHIAAVLFAVEYGVRMFEGKTPMYHVPGIDQPTLQHRLSLLPLVTLTSQPQRKSRGCQPRKMYASGGRFHALSCMK